MLVLLIGIEHLDMLIVSIDIIIEKLFSKI